MTNNLKTRGIVLVAALALTACPTTKKCNSNDDCGAGETCSVMSGLCTTGGTGGGTGGGSGGGTVGGGTGGGSTGGGTGTGGGTATGGGTGGGSSDGGVTGGETCEQAAVPASLTFDGTTIATASDYNLARFADGTGCNGYSTHPGGDVVYALTVPARSSISVTVQGQGGDGLTMANPVFDPAAYLVAQPAANCNNATADGGVEARCIAASPDPLNDPADLSAPEVVTWKNFGAETTVFLVVESGWESQVTGLDTDGDNTDDMWAIGEGAFTVTVTSTALPPAPANDTCTSPTTLTAGTPLATETTVGAAPDLTFAAGSTCLDTSAFGDVFYTATVQPGERLTVSATTQTANNGIGLNIFEGGCAAVSTCKSGSSSTAGTAASAFWDNTGATPAAVTIQVVTAGGDDSGTTFSLSATAAAIPPPPANNTCASAVTLVSGTPLTGQTTVGATADLTFSAASTCIDTTGVGDAFYSISVGAGERLTVNATTPTARINVNLFTAACAMVDTCTSDSSTGSPASARWDNTTAAPVTVMVQISIEDSAGLGATFDVTATAAPIPPPPANDTCAAPAVLTAATTTQGTTISAVADTLFAASPTGCRGTAGLKKDVYYTLVIPTGKTATITVTPAGTLDTLINVLDSTTTCSGVTMCIASNDMGNAGEADVATYVNASGADKTVLLQVASWFGEEGDFTINAIMTP